MHHWRIDQTLGMGLLRRLKSFSGSELGSEDGGDAMAQTGHLRE